MRLCWQDAATSQRQSRMSDAGYYYCQQRRQSAMSPDRGVQQFQGIRPPRDSTEAMLDEFAVGAASRILCP